MAEIKTDNRQETAIYTPPRLLEPKFYTETISVELTRAGFRLNQIDPNRPPKTKREFTGGIYDNSILRVIEPLDSNGTSVFELLAKILHPSKRIIIDTLDHSNLESRAKYEFTHLKLWNELGIPSPKAITLFSDESNGLQIHIILMKYLKAPFHDLDIIAINAKLNEYNEVLNALNNKDNDNGKKRTIKTYIEDLEKEKEKVIKSILKTQIETELLGTHFLNYGRSKAKKFPINIYSLEDQLKSAIYCAKEFKLKNDKDTGKVHPQAKDLNPNTGESIGTDYNTSFAALMEILFDKIFFRYTQGDEFLHHYAFDEVDGKLASLVVDANLTQIVDPMCGVMKTLTSPLLICMPYDKLVEFIDYRNTTLIERANQLKGKMDGMDELLKRSESDIKHSFLRGDLFALFLIPKLMGLKSRDENKHLPHFLEILRAEKPYGDNGKINFPNSDKPSFVSFRQYSTEKIISALQKRLNQVIERLHKNKSEYRLDSKLERIIYNVEDFLKRNHYFQS